MVGGAGVRAGIHGFSAADRWLLEEHLLSLELTTAGGWLGSDSRDMQRTCEIFFSIRRGPYSSKQNRCESGFFGVLIVLRSSLIGP